MTDAVHLAHRLARLERAPLRQAIEAAKAAIGITRWRYGFAEPWRVERLARAILDSERTECNPEREASS